MLYSLVFKTSERSLTIWSSVKEAGWVKVIQLNAWGGKCLDAMVNYLQERRPDIITLQEVTGGRENLGEDKTINLFSYLRDKLGMGGVLGKLWEVKGDPYSYFGSAVLVRPDLGEIQRQTVVWLTDAQDLPRALAELNELPDRGGYNAELLSRRVLDLQIDFQGQGLHIISAHLAWAKESIDTPEKLRQVKVLCRYLEQIIEAQEPIILGGDFNCAPYSQVVGLIGERLDNWVAHTTSVSTTINSHLHRAVKYPLIVDYICSLGFSLKKLAVPYTVDVSDHFPIEAELELN